MVLPLDTAECTIRSSKRQALPGWQKRGRWGTIGPFSKRVQPRSSDQYCGPGAPTRASGWCLRAWSGSHDPGQPVAMLATALALCDPTTARAACQGGAMQVWRIAYMAPQIVLLGALDTKGMEFAYLRAQLLRTGLDPLVIDSGVLGPPLFEPHIGAAEVAAAARVDLDALRRQADRGYAMAVMGRGAAALVRQLYDAGRLDGIIGMGGSGGSSVIATAMQALPVGVPKLLVSTVAAGDTRSYVGSRDITLMPSVVDVAGLNRISRRIITNAANAIAGMITGPRAEAASDDRPLIAASMFGNTTACVDRARSVLEAHGYEVLVFHATGIGGQTMESLIADGFISAALDITTTEWADELCGGVFSAGTSRLDAAAGHHIPQLVVPGCLDMVNFGSP